MGRAKRLLYDGAVYHIISRGHNRYKIFNTSVDYDIFKDLLKGYKGRYRYYLFHYCLMPNHTHLLLKIERGRELPNLMQCINQSYARYYRMKYGLIGNLFQGRYKSLHIAKDEYLIECGRYIERNPLRANMVDDLGMYRFSSFNFYANGNKDDIIDADPLYEKLAEDPQERRKAYKRYVLEPMPYEYVIDQKFDV